MSVVIAQFSCHQVSLGQGRVFYALGIDQVSSGLLNLDGGVSSIKTGESLQIKVDDSLGNTCVIGDDSTPLPASVFSAKTVLDLVLVSKEGLELDAVRVSWS